MTHVRTVQNRVEANIDFIVGLRPYVLDVSEVGKANIVRVEEAVDVRFEDTVSVGNIQAGRNSVCINFSSGVKKGKTEGGFRIVLRRADSRVVVDLSIY